MKAFKGIPWWASLLGLLFMANLAWMAWNANRYADLHGAVKRFKVEVLHTNGVSGIGLFLRLKGGKAQPLWTEFDLNHDGEPDTENYFFRGRGVLDIHMTNNQSPRYSLFFLGEGKSSTWWLDRRGNGSFTERIYYDTNGAPTNHEVWYQDAWHVVDRREGTNGIVISGKWHRLHFGTNVAWTVEPDSVDH